MSHPSEHLLHAYLDEELAPEEQAQIAAHLAACPVCAARLHELQALFITLESLPEAPLARDLSPTVLRRIRPATAASPRLRWIVGLELAAAFSILIITLPALYQRFLPLFIGMDILAERGFLAWIVRLSEFGAGLFLVDDAFFSFIPIDQIVAFLW
ncbi:MAG: hypothetical protein GXP42_00970, partial [Chloroflexi bacterium]|nr:hypothetical protein [Chloroflexota bacterium]